MLRCENSTLAIIGPLLLINGTNVSILWVGLAKHSKEISCSRNLVAARNFYDVRRTFCASSYENLVEKVQDMPQVSLQYCDEMLLARQQQRISSV